MVISYAGKERCDLPYYMTLLASKTGLNILVVDNSIRHDFFHVFEMREEVSTVPRDGFVITKDCDVDKTDIREYDFVFLYNGLYEPAAPYKMEADLEFVACSCDKTEMKMTKKAIEASGIGTGSDAILVISDLVESKLSSGFISEYVGMTPLHVYVTDFDAKDIEQYYLLTQNGTASLAHLSDNYKGFLRDFANAFLGIDAKAAKKIIR